MARGSQPPVWSIVVLLLLVSVGVTALTTAHKLWWMVGIAAGLWLLALVIYALVPPRRKRSDV
jgi:membrane protein YdbS with pleckstrin-like domain